MQKEPIKILIVDDQHQSIQFLKKHLEPIGYAVTGASSSKEALEIIQKEYFDLILLDVDMPEADGFQLCANIKESKETCHIPVIFTTTRGGVTDKVKGLEVGASDYIPKPFEPEELKARIKAVLRTKKLQDDLKQKASYLEEQAIIDSLTGLYNRRYIKDRLLEEIARAKRFKEDLSLVLSDLDKFQEINQNHGTQKGDIVLKEFSDILKKSIRNIDIIGRFGGGEFIFIFPQTNLEGAVTAAEKIRKKIAENIFLSGELKIKLTASFGVASLTPDIIETFQALLDGADIALSKAKVSGRNKVSTWKD